MSGGVGTGLFFERDAYERLEERDIHWPPAKTDPMVAILDVDRDGLASKLGAPVADGYDLLPGLGRIEAWSLRFACGCEVSLCWRHDMRAELRLGAEVFANDPDIDHVLHHVTDVLAAPVSWRPTENPRDPDPWSLVRQGDDGNRVLVHTFDSSLAAECARRTFEARGHKQLYTVERAAR